MTRSYGGGPERERQKNKQPELNEEGGWEQKLDSLSRYNDDESHIQPVRVDFGKRLVAMLIDVFVAYIIGSIVGLIPMVNDFISLQLVMTLFLLTRDFLFDGRGIGKNLMGLQVVDVSNGQPCSLLQSIRRNIILYGPLLTLYIIMAAMRLINVFMKGANIPYVGDTVYAVINTLGAIYTIFVIPYEAYRVYNRADGRRFGDQFSGTAVVEAPMDFSRPLPRQ